MHALQETYKVALLPLHDRNLQLMLNPSADPPLLPFETVVTRFVNYAIGRIIEDATRRGIEMDRVYELIQIEVRRSFAPDPEGKR